MRLFSKKTLPFFTKSCLIAILVVFLWGLYSALPLWRIMRPHWLFQTHLVVIMNEHEARPCGGFITAYGAITPWKLSGSINNSYAIGGQTFGQAPIPIKDFTPELHFWDLSTNPNINECQSDIQNAYQQATDTKIDAVHFLNINVITQILEILGPINVENQTIDHASFFAILSRSVANVDRHDETTLAERKNILSVLGKKIITKTLLSPHKWPALSTQINRSISNGDLYINHVSPKIQKTENAFGLIEWNLGGAKSSRYLQKDLTINYRETAPNQWDITAEVNIHHLGQIDEPLSQNWKGSFEIALPSFLQKKSEYISLTIEPGDSYQKKFTFQHQGPLPINTIAVFQPRMANTWATISLSLFGQQTIAPQSHTFQTQQESTAFSRTLPAYGTTNWSWLPQKDTTQPFVTFHQFITNPAIQNKYPQIKYSDIQAEIHFNEPITINPESFYAQLLDRNYENLKDHTMILSSYVLLKDDRTLLIGFVNKVPQQNERYFLQLTGITDKANNPLQNGKRTLIDRT